MRRQLPAGHIRALACIVPAGYTPGALLGSSDGEDLFGTTVEE
jgi:hypothetical protein